MATLPTTGSLTTETLVSTFAGKKPFSIQRKFNLSTLLAAVVANADVVNLLNIPAKTNILSGVVEIVTAGTKDATTFTVKLRLDTTDLSAALDATATGIAGGTTPLLAAAAGKINLVVACSGGNAVVTKNPVVMVTLTCVNVAG